MDTFSATEDAVGGDFMRSIFSQDATYSFWSQNPVSRLKTNESWHRNPVMWPAKKHKNYENTKQSLTGLFITKTN